MNTFYRIGVLVAAASVSLGGAAFAVPPRISTGAELVSACAAAKLPAPAPDDRVAGASCHQFLAGMVAAIYASTENGRAMTVYRLGAKADESVCIRLPEMLKFETFAEEVTAYAPEHPELYARPAFEMAARTLAKNYPCPE